MGQTSNQRKFLFLLHTVHDHDHELSCDTHLQEDFSTYSEWHFEMLGGTAQVNISEWEEWSLTVKYDPRLCILGFQIIRTT